LKSSKAIARACALDGLVHAAAALGDQQGKITFAWTIAVQSYDEHASNDRVE